MNNYILILSVGPVQDFIAAARRSRDLWSGSWLLSEISKAVASHLYKRNTEQEKSVDLIIPAFTEDAPTNLQANSSFSVGNKIQVRIAAENTQEVANLAAEAAQVARQRFKDIAQDAKTKLDAGLCVKDIAQEAKTKLHAGLREDIWQMQIEDYVEIQAAWAQITPLGYRTACDCAEQLLAARKATRYFLPSATAFDDERYCLPKSSLDGARETVLFEEKLNETARRKLGLKKSEQLDCAGIVKRLGGDPEQFTPLTRIAAHTWLAALPAEAREQIAAAYKSLINLELATRVRGNQECYQDFPYDAQFVYRSRLEAEISAMTASLKKAFNQELSNDRKKLENLQNTLKPIWCKHGEPCAYGVLLQADGDHMGKLLDKAKNIEEHQNITRQLSAFAGNVAEIMRKHDGHCIYAGGDDVLGFVPLNQAYDCAEALKNCFTDAMTAVAENMQATIPTLSVGLAIAHINTPLGQIRELAKQTEKFAKGDNCASDKQRNALAITLAIRSGNTSNMRLQWSDAAAHSAFKGWISAFAEKKLPSRIAYDLRAIYLRTNFPFIGDQGEQAADISKIRQAEMLRMLKQARDESGKEINKKLIEELEKRLEQLQDLNALATELIIARWFAAKTQQELEKR